MRTKHKALLSKERGSGYLISGLCTGSQPRPYRS